MIDNMLFLGFVTGAVTYGWILPAIGKLMRKLRKNDENS